jgi:hypothetical protein
MPYPVEWRRRLRERYNGFFRRRVAIPGRATLLRSREHYWKSSTTAARLEPRPPNPDREIPSEMLELVRNELGLATSAHPSIYD